MTRYARMPTWWLEVLIAWPLTSGAQVIEIAGELERRAVEREIEASDGSAHRVRRVREWQ